MKWRDVLPYPLWSRLMRLRTWAAEAPERARIAALEPRVPRDRIALWTGFPPPAPGAVQRGGRVKLAALQRAFPGSADEFNVLYLVSSGLPPAAGAWIELARARGARVVWNQNGIAYPGWIGPAHELLNRPFRDLIPLTDAVLYQSEYCRRSTEHFLGQIAKKSLMMYNCVDTTRFTPGDALVPDPLILLAAGTQQGHHRVRGLLETLRDLLRGGSRVRLLVAGAMTFEGGRALFDAMMDELGVTEAVEVLGPYARESAPDVFRRAHILLHPQYKDACPTTVLEALACGLPVVATDSGGLPELLGAGGEVAGRLVPVPDTWDRQPAPDPVAMAGAVRAVAADLPRLSALARRRAVERFDERDWLAAHERLFRELLALEAR
jgi:glycosyltransferase involved in cell wall biosynthesis